MGFTGTSGNGIQRVLILGVSTTTSSQIPFPPKDSPLTTSKDNFPATPIIHALAHSPRNYTLHIAHPHEPITPPHPKTTYHSLRINPSALSPLLHALHPDIVIDTTPGPSDSKAALIDCLVASGINRFIPAEFGQDSLNPGIQARLPASRERAQTIAYLTRLGDAGTITWSAVAVGVVLDRGLRSANLGFDLAWRNAGMHGSGEERFAASSAGWIGEVVCGMLDHWEDARVRNRYLRAAGMVTTANAVLASLEREMGTGRSWTADRGDVEACVREAEKRIERGFPDAGMFLMERSVLYDGRVDAAGAFETEDAKAALGLSEGESLEELVRGVVHEYEHHGGKKAGCGCG